MASLASDLYSASGMPSSIAVVGMAVHLPGSEDSNALWDLLERGGNTLSEIPPERFDYAQYHDNTWNRSGRRMSTRYGNFMDDHDIFDNHFFHISPREARSMDPQQRLLLHTAYQALEDAGYSPDATGASNPETFATYIGVATGDYVHNLRDNIDVYYSTGTLQAFLSGKIAYAFGLGGPSMVIDTACSSSIVALHHACRALQNGDCNAAIAGGVNVISSLDMYLGLSRGHFLSETGQCRPWDASADGYCRSEGCGLFVLKRLTDALAENDRILGIIRSTSTNQSAHASSITRPHIPAQVALFQKLVSSAGIDPLSISVAECHGTGTQAGDPAELEAVRTVFANGRTADNPLHITSVKANIGHAEAASGAASLAKLILMMRHRKIPRHISFDRLNPGIKDLSCDNICIDTTEFLWIPREGRRLALLTNFGAAGSNAALILEEYAPPPRQSIGLSTSGIVVALSCRSMQAAEERRATYITQLNETVLDDTALQDFAYSATARRQLHNYRISASGTTKHEVLQNLSTASVVEVSPADDVIFVFSGQGSQYLGMGAELYHALPFVSEFVDSCNKTLVTLGFESVLFIFQGQDSATQTRDDLALFEALQPALFILECAIAKLLIEWGITPSVVVGHCFGEYAALVFAGVLTLEDALVVVAARARLVARECVPAVTGMSSVRASAAEVVSLLYDLPGLEIGCYNGESHCTVGGPCEQLDTFDARCSSQGIRCTRLNVPYAYHSSAIDPVLSDLRALGKAITFSPPRIPILSNVTGTLVQPGEPLPFTPDYFARHCREPARFQQGIAHLAAQIDMSTVAACIELGAHPTTLAFMRSLQAGGEPLLLPTLRKNSRDFEVLCGSLAQLYCTSVPVKWRSVFRHIAPEARLVDLPAYPFAKTRFWVPFKENTSQKESERNKPTPLPYTSAPCEIEEEVVFERDIHSLSDLIEGHRVAGQALCPASVYAELVRNAAMSVLRNRSSWNEGVDVLELAHCVYPNALVYNPGRPTKLCTAIQPVETQSGTYSISSVIEGDDRDVGAEPRVHCSGSYRTRSLKESSAKLQYAAAMLEREIQNLQSGPPDNRETFGTRTVYDLLFPQVVTYSEAYRAIQSMTVNTTQSTAYAVIQVPRCRSTSESDHFVVHPIFVDTLFHTAGFLANFTAGFNGKDAYICVSVDKVKIPPNVDTLAHHGVYASVLHIDKGVIVVDAYAVELDSPERRVVAHLKRARFQKVAMASLARVLKLAAGLTVTGDGENSIHNTVVNPHSCPVSEGQLARRLPVYADIHDEVLRLVSETSGIARQEITPEAQLTHLGIDSLMFWELVPRLRVLVSGSADAAVVDMHTFAEAVTVQDLVRIVLEKKGPAGRTRGISNADSFMTLCESEEDAIFGSPSELAADTKLNSPSLATPVVPDIESIKATLSSVLDIPAERIADGEDLSHLGLDSLTFIEVCALFRTNLDLRVDPDVFLKCRTVYDIAKSFSNSRSPPLQCSPSPCIAATEPSGPKVVQPELICLQTGSAAGIPLVLIHDGSGFVNGYAKIAPLGRDVWAIQNTGYIDDPALQHLQQGEELVAMARNYVTLLMSALFKGGHGASRECIIGGWSFGGVVAFEMARQLPVYGVSVKGLILIDSPAPQTISSVPVWMIDAVVDKAKTARSHRMAETIKAQMQYAAQALVAYHKEDRIEYISSAYHPHAVLLQSRLGVDGFAEKWDTELDTRVRAFFTKNNDEWTVGLWEDALGAKIDVLDIPGDHFETFDIENVMEVSEQLRVAITMVLCG